MHPLQDILTAAEESGLTKTMIRLTDNYEWVTARLVKGEWQTCIVPAGLYSPLATAGLTIVTDPDLSKYYIKYPVVPLECQNLDLIKGSLAREVKACEILKEHPHPNIVQYHGCIVMDGLVRAICYSKHPHTVSEKVNPHHVPKKYFQYSQSAPLKDRAKFLKDLEAAVAHLHSLGLIHNDLKPQNLMVSSEETLILIDFDSCMPVNEPLKGCPRTAEWHDPSACTAQFSNDLKAFDEIRMWLSDEKVKQYHFQTGLDSCSA